MRKIYLLLVFTLILSVVKADAQCTMTGRYTSNVFSSYDLSSVQYGTYITSNGSDSMDIYQPHGDTFSKRPVLIMAHGGSFVDGSRSLTSSQTDVCVDTFCLRNVRRGFVTVSIDYRMAASPLDMTVSGYASGSAADVVAKAISDGKAAIRYLVQHAATYRIDTNNIFIGGNSAGAVLYMHVGYLDSVGECTPLMVGALSANGGFEGNSGNPQSYPTTKAKGIVNMAGALASVAIASPGDLPSVNCQGSLDATVPYTCGLPLSNACPDTLCGLGSLAPQYTTVGITHWDTVFVGQQHVPWDGDAGMMNSVDSLSNAFMYNLVCNNVTYVNIVNANTEVRVFPNPATEALNVSSQQALSSVMMYDEMGRIVMQANGINSGFYQMNTSRLNKGVYFVRIRFSDENNAPAVRQVVIQ